MSVLDDIGIDAIELRPQDIHPQWLIDLAEKCRTELEALPPSAQPSWYRWNRERYLP